MHTLVPIAALVFAAALPAQAAGSDDVLTIYGSPRNRVRTLAARVARQKQLLHLIAARVEPESRPAEATVQDLLRWLDRQATRRPVYGDMAVR